MNFLLTRCSLVLIIVVEVALYFQNDYVVTNERFVMSNIDKNYAIVDFRSVMYNRTYRVVNATFHIKQNMGYDVNAVVQAYKYASNEYREFPIFLKINLCTVLSEDTFGFQNVYDCGNFTKCPVKKGTYVICNWAPDQSKLPPHHPRGRFMAEIKLLYGEKEIGMFQWYTKVESKITWQ